MNGETQFSDFELERYSRQIRIEGFGVDGQRRLKNATVLVSRVGGVGGYAAFNLVCAGIGKLVLAHAGTIGPEYLNRWPWALPSDVGRPIIEMIAERLKAANPEVEIESYGENVSEANVAGLVAKADLVLDGAPLFEERYLLNAQSVRQEKPMVSAAVYSTDGYVTTIRPGRTPCLACIYPEKPAYWTDIKVFPVLGPTPAVVASMAAMEVIKVLAAFGEPLENVLWYLDHETARVRLLNIARRADCKVCGTAVRATPAS